MTISSSVALSLLLCLSACTTVSEKKKPTYERYSIADQSHKRYTTDTVRVRKSLEKLLANRIKPFALKLYDSLTKTYIDTLVYGPDQRKMIVLTIVKNSTWKLEVPKAGAPFFYDGYYVLAVSDSIEKDVILYPYNGYGLAMFYDYDAIRNDLRYYCFNRMAEADSEAYNIDDVRFWNSEHFQELLNSNSAK